MITVCTGLPCQWATVITLIQAVWCSEDPLHSCTVQCPVGARQECRSNKTFLIHWNDTGQLNKWWLDPVPSCLLHWSQCLWDYKSEGRLKKFMGFIHILVELRVLLVQVESKKEITLLRSHCIVSPSNGLRNAHSKRKPRTTERSMHVNGKQPI